jgi:hypothetical protein
MGSVTAERVKPWKLARRPSRRSVPQFRVRYHENCSLEFAPAELERLNPRWPATHRHLQTAGSLRDHRSEATGRVLNEVLSSRSQLTLSRAILS